ncbi:uncharacterized protein LOC143291755 isoform X2 [Babylonia areolata]|uniref:uncharacterized protein LOC143291755 isoform X2 n=1 Tax=Babylonia areolata TaxID=304850 RepID=UPI003FD64458
MARTFWGVLVTILWLCVAVRTGAEMTDLRTITCFARAVSMGGPGVVTCHFPVAITQSGSITVDHYSLDEEVPGSVFDCLGNVKECEPDDKYKILSDDGTDLVFSIPNVTEDYMGTYRCQMELKGGAGRLNAGVCNLTITGTVPTTNTSPSTTVGPSQSGTDKDSGSDEKRDVGPNVPAIAVVVCVCVVIVGAIVGCLVYRRRRICQRGQSPEMRMEESGTVVVELEAREQRGEHEAGGEHGPHHEPSTSAAQTSGLPDGLGRGPGTAISILTGDSAPQGGQLSHPSDKEEEPAAAVSETRESEGDRLMEPSADTTRPSQDGMGTNRELPDPTGRTETAGASPAQNKAGESVSTASTGAGWRQTGSTASTGADRRQTGSTPSTGADRRQTGSTPSTGADRRQTGSTPSTGADRRQTGSTPSTGADWRQGGDKPSQKDGGEMEETQPPRQERGEGEKPPPPQTTRLTPSTTKPVKETRMLFENNPDSERSRGQPFPSTSRTPGVQNLMGRHPPGSIPEKPSPSGNEGKQADEEPKSGESGEGPSPADSKLSEQPDISVSRNTEEEPEETPEEEEEKEPLLPQGPTGGDEDENAEDKDHNV